MASGLCALLVSGEYPPMQGGVSDFTHLVGEALADLGVRVHVLTSVHAEQRNGAQVVCHPLVENWSFGQLYGATRRLLRAIRPDVINIQYQTAAYGMHPAVNLLPLVLRPLPTVVTFHDLLVPYLFPKAGPLRWWANLALARSSRAVIATNAEDEARLASHRGLGMLQRIPIGSNVPCAPPPGFDRQAWRRARGIDDAALVLCYFGFLNASKGGEELVAALALLRDAGNDARLLMIGGTLGASDPTNRDYLRAVERSINVRDLQQYVLWTGYMPPEDVSAAFQSADVCVLPYRDGASFRRGSFMAALTHAMPIVTTQPGAHVPELVNGENVLLVPPRDPEALVAAITRLARDGALRKRLAQGAQRLSGEFDWHRIAERTIEVYHAAVS